MHLATHGQSSITQLRSVPSPGIFAGVNGGPLRHRFFFSRTPEPEVNGPFHDEKDFGMAMAIRSMRLRDDHPEHRAWAAESSRDICRLRLLAMPACLPTQTFRE